MERNESIKDQQIFTASPSQAYGAGHYSVSLAIKPDHVIRHTPMAPRRKLCVWAKDDTAVNQFFKITELGQMYPVGQALGIGMLGDDITMAVVPGKFYFDVVFE